MDVLNKNINKYNNSKRLSNNVENIYIDITTSNV